MQLLEIIMVSFWRAALRIGILHFGILMFNLPCVGVRVNVTLCILRVPPSSGWARLAMFGHAAFFLGPSNLVTVHNAPIFGWAPWPTLVVYEDLWNMPKLRLLHHSAERLQPAVRLA